MISNYRLYHTPYQPPRGSYKKYYETSQFGHGGILPAYMGGKSQKGHGIGSLLATIARAAIPLAVPLLKTAGKAVATAGLTAGAGALADVIAGKGVKKSVTTHARAAGSNLLKRAGDSNYIKGVMQPPPAKRTATSKGGGSKRKKKKSKSTLF